jgi:hypothetical protein
VGHTLEIMDLNSVMRQLAKEKRWRDACTVGLSNFSILKNTAKCGWSVGGLEFEMWGS